MVSRLSPVVVDTSVVSILYRGLADSRYDFYWSRLRGRHGLIAFQTLEEQLFGARLRRWGTRRMTLLRQHLRQYDVVWPDRRLVEISAHLRSEQRQAGRVLSLADAWIAATAILHQCPLASDDGDFSVVPGLELIRLERG